MASAPPEPPSPVITVTIGVRSRVMSATERAIDSAMPRSSDSAPDGRNVDERDDREAEALGELHDPDRLAIALRVRHPEVAPDVLVGVGPLLLTDDRDHAAVEPGQAGHDRGVVAEQPVAVELDEVLGHGGRRTRASAASAGCGPAGRGPTPPRYGRRCWVRQWFRFGAVGPRFGDAIGKVAEKGQRPEGRSARASRERPYRGRERRVAGSRAAAAVCSARSPGARRRGPRSRG